MDSELELGFQSAPCRGTCTAGEGRQQSCLVTQDCRGGWETGPPVWLWVCWCAGRFPGQTGLESSTVSSSEEVAASDTLPPEAGRCWAPRGKRRAGQGRTCALRSLGVLGRQVPLFSSKKPRGPRLKKGTKSEVEQIAPELKPILASVAGPSRQSGNPRGAGRRGCCGQETV